MTRDEFLMMVVIEMAVNIAWFPGLTSRTTRHRVIRLATQTPMGEISDDRTPFVAKEFVLWAMNPEQHDRPPELGMSKQEYGPRDVRWLGRKLYILDGLFAYLAIEVSTRADEEAVYLQGRAMMPVEEFNRARRVEDGRRA